MNDAQFFLATTLFCNKYFGIPLKTVENVPKNIAIDIIKNRDYNVSRGRFSFFYVGEEVLFWNSSRGITFYIDHTTPSNGKSNVKLSYSTIEEFLKTFKIPLEDIV